MHLSDIGKKFTASLLVMLLLSYTVCFVANLKIILSEVEIPNEVRMYLDENEKVREYLRVSYTLPPQDSTTTSVVDLVFYEVLKNGKTTREYIVWDNIKKSVVGGVNWPVDFSLPSYMVILSYLEHESIKEFFDKNGKKMEEFGIIFNKLASSANNLMKDIEKQKETWTIISVTVVSFAVSLLTGGAIIGILVSAIKFVWRLSKLSNLIYEWDVKPEKYPAFYTSIIMLGTFTDVNEQLGDSSRKLKEILERIKTKKELIENLTNLNDASIKIQSIGLKLVEEYGEGVAVDYLSKLVVFWTATSLHSIRGILGNDKFYSIFGEGLTGQVERVAFRLLGGEEATGVSKEEFSKIVSRLGKFFGAKFRPSALKGIRSEEIIESFKSYERMMEKTFSKDMLLKTLKWSLISVALELATEFITKSIIDILNKDIKEIATNCYIHSEIIRSLSDMMRVQSKEIEENLHLRNYVSLLQAQLYSTMVRENAEEMWDLLNITFNSKASLLQDSRISTHMGEWLREQCGGEVKNKESFSECAGRKFDELYHFWSSATNDYSIIEERIMRFADSYIKNMTRRLGNAIPKVQGRVNVVLTLDKSGSMRDKFLDSTKIEILKDAASLIIDLFSTTGGNIKAGIVSFSDFANVEAEITDDYKNLKAVVYALAASGSTAMGDALHLSLELLKSGEKAGQKVSNVIILLTDGKFNTGRNPRTVLYDEIIPASIPVFTIGIGKGVEEYDPEILKEIAERTNAIFYEVDPSKGIDRYALQKIFLKIGLAITGGGEVVDQKVLSLSQNEVFEDWIDVSDGGSFAIIAQYSGSKVSLKLYDPNGSMVEPSARYISVSRPGFEAWVINEPIRGSWKIKVIGEDVPTDKLTVFLSKVKTAIEVTPSQVSINITENKAQTFSIKVTSKTSQVLRNLKISIHGGISRIAHVKPETIDTLEPFSTREIIFVVNPPLIGDYYDGFLIIFDGWFRHTVPLKVFYNYLDVQAYMDKKSYRVGDHAIVEVAVRDQEGHVITNADVIAYLDNVTYILNDDGVNVDKNAGDGVYSIEVPLNVLSGVHTLRIRVEKADYIPSILGLSIYVKKFPGDVNNDGKVDYIDLGMLAKVYGTRIDEVEYFMDADLNEDGKVDYLDLGLLALNYGKAVLQ